MGSKVVELNISSMLKSLGDMNITQGLIDEELLERQFQTQ